MPNGQPNILVVHTDQHRWDCFGAAGNPDLQTPNIDQLAADGVRYDESFCSFPVCTPSRYSLLSGLYVHQHLGWSNHCTIPAGLATFPKLLRDAGYKTQAVGKMHFAPTYLDVGFDKMLLAEQDGPGRFDDDYHRWLRDEGLCDRLDIMDQRGEYRQDAPREYWDSFGARVSDLDEKHHSTTWIGDRAVEAMDGWTDGGNLLMAGFIKPHHPFDPPAPWADMYDPDALTILPGWTEELLAADHGKGYFPCTGLDEKRLRKAMALYYATISQIDHHVGRMIDCLKRKGLYENTMIVFTSDHGDYLGFHHRLLKGFKMFDPLMKVPLLIKYPGGTDAGKIDPRLVSNIDVAPTILHCAGQTPAPDMGGLDLRDPRACRDIVFAEYARSCMARSQTKKLLLNRDSAQSHFYDLQADPLEMDNRYDDPDRQDEIAELRDRLLRWSLFESRTPVHLDPDAPLCAGENVPRRDDNHVAEAQTYFHEKMDEGFQWTPGQ